MNIQRLARIGLFALPVLTLLSYATFVAYYGHHLASNLSYIRPALPAALGDVLRLGFWPTWAIVLALLASLCALAYRFATRAKGYYVAVTLIFALLSVADFV